MKKFNKIIVAGAVILVIAATSVTALAATAYTSPSEIVAALTGQSADSVQAEKTADGTTYGAIAEKAGVLEDFKAEMLEWKKAVLAERVAAGQITQERADAIIAAMAENQADCDGTGNGAGACAGSGMGGIGQGKGYGKGGFGCGAGMNAGKGPA